MSKGVMLFIFILFAVGFFGAYYLGKNSQDVSSVNALQKTEKPMGYDSNWQTYTNSSYGFSLKYPTNWPITDKKTLFTTALDAKWLNSSGDRCTGECVELVLYDNLNIDKAKSSTGDAGMASSASATVEKVHGKEVTKVVRTFSSLVGETGRWVEDKDKAYLVYIPVGDEYLQLKTNLNNKVTLDKIVETFSDFK